MGSRVRALTRLVMACALALTTVGPASGAAASAATAAGGSRDAAHPYRHGTQLTVEYQRSHARPVTSPAVGATSVNDLNYGGGIGGVGVTTGPPRVYLVFWGSQWGSQSANSQGDLTFSGDTRGMAPYYQEFFKGLGVNNELWSGVMTQFCEGVASGSQTCPTTSSHVGYPTGGALAGVWADTASATPTQSTGHQLAQEGVNAAGHFGNVNAASNRSAQYVIVSPTGTHPDGFNTPTANWCAWHDYNGDSTLSGGGAVSSPYGNLAFTNMPYVTDLGTSCGQNFVNGGSAGTLDGVSIVGGHEYAETITDQFPAGGWTDTTGAENGDKCAWISSGQGASQNISLSTGSFAVQSTWSNDFNSGSGGCQVSHPIVTNGSSNDFSLAVSPASQSVTAGSSTTYTVTTAVTSGSATTVSLTVSGVPAGASGSFNPASVSAGGTSTLTVSTTASTPAATSTLTVTGNNGSFSHQATASLVVAAPASSDFSLAVSPASQSVSAGSSVSYTVSTAVTSGSALTVSLTASGVPAGASASFNPSSVTAGGTSTMTVSTSPATAAGNYTITVSGSSSGPQHTASAGLTVTAPSSGGPTNGGFESGLAGWTPAGSTSVSTTAHSGSQSAMVGGSSPTNGDSSVAQTFTVPSSGGVLSFWYRVVCPDTVTYDWATATLKDNTSGTTSTMLARTCTNSGAWVKSAGASLTAGHSVTLTLISHDDNYAGDPTYTLYDDVAISAPVSSPLVNGGFETGSLSGWTASGARTGVSTSAHSGVYSADLGGTSPTNGDSAITQTFTLPAGARTLSFWYQVHCPDTVTYDWATATLKDNATASTTTLLARTCTNGGAWVQVSAPVGSMAGHSVTLTLVSHDDNYAGDPTYTLYDDVTVS